MALCSPNSVAKHHLHDPPRQQQEQQQEHQQEQQQRMEGLLTPETVPASLFVAAAPAALTDLPGQQQRAALVHHLVSFLRYWDAAALEPIPSSSSSSGQSALAAQLPWPVPPGLLDARTESHARCWLGYV